VWSGDVLQTFGLAMAILFLTVIYYYHGRKTGLAELGPALGLSPESAGIFGGPYQCACALLLLLLPPLLIARFGLRIPLADLGFRVGDWRWGLKATVVALAILVPGALLTAGGPQGLCTLYPLAGWAGDSTASFLAWEACYLGYYVAWEGLFRGIIQQGMQARFGPIQAMVLQTALTTFLHAGHPEVETLAALAGGPVLGYLALRSGSILYPLAIHFALGMATDASCLWMQG
jgi:membrane protease YdiL (CAAX protease family)